MTARAPRSAPPPQRLRLAVLCVCVAACRSEVELQSPQPARLPARGMVVCEHPLAADVGADILARGGNAADAAVASALALAVVYPQAGNLGGGGFALWVPHEGKSQALDFRETAPSGARPELYVDQDGAPSPELLQSGAYAVATPGSPAGLWDLHAGFGSGRFTFSELVAPAIRLARNGFEVDAVLAGDLEREAHRVRLSRYPGARARFYPAGQALVEGEVLVQADLADTLERYAREGPRGFYRGPVATAILDELAAVAAQDGLEPGAGRVTAADLEGYESIQRAPLRGWFRGHEVITMPPPSSGGLILLQVLAVLDGFPLDAQREARLRELEAAGQAAGAAEFGGIDERIVHWWIEALRRAFAERAVHHGDPDFHEVPVGRLLSADWIARTRMSISERADPEDDAQALREGESTTHLSVLDPRGNAVSLTTTINSSFGSGILVRGAGFLLNNEMDDFSLGMEVSNQFALVGGAANAVEAGKRPLSSMTPAVVRTGGSRTRLVLGSPGGPRIITAVTGVILRTLVFEEPLAGAVEAPRFHQQWSPARTEFEAGWSAELLEALERRGHGLLSGSRRWASVQAIAIGEDGSVEGVSDSRRGGAARGARP